MIYFLPVFILCHAVKWIPNIWELLTSVDDEVKKQTSFDHFQMYHTAYIKFQIVTRLYRLYNYSSRSTYFDLHFFILMSSVN